MLGKNIRNEIALKVQQNPSMINPPMHTLADRVHWEPAGNGICLFIPSRKDWRLAFFGFWLAGWTAGGNAIIHQTVRKFASGSIDWFNCLWLVGWAFGECFVFAWIVWALGGKTMVLLDPATITIDNRLFGLLLRRRAASTAEVRNLRYTPRTQRGRSITESNISFESGYKTWSFGSGLSDAEALAVISKMLQIYEFPKERALECVDLSR